MTTRAAYVIHQTQEIYLHEMRLISRNLFMLEGHLLRSGSYRPSAFYATFSNTQRLLLQSGTHGRQLLHHLQQTLAGPHACPLTINITEILGTAEAFNTSGFRFQQPVDNLMEGHPYALLWMRLLSSAY